MFERISFKRRLQVLSVALVLLIVPLLLLAIHTVSRSVTEDRRERTRRVVEVAVGLANYWVKEAEAGHLTREQAQASAIAQLRGLRYEREQYFWINDFDARMVMHPTKPGLEGQDLSSFRDPHGKPIFLDFAALGRTPGHGFVEYDWPRPGSAKPVPKVSFVQSVPSWGWVIGSGVYMDDVQAAVARMRNQLLGTSALIALVGLAIGWLFWRLLGGARPPLGVVRPPAAANARASHARTGTD